jgi:cell division protein FtsX
LFGASPDRAVGIKIMLISGFIFLAILFALAMCVVHSVRNIITIHRREIGIMNQIGATPNYIARQIQMAMMALGAKACAAGTIAGWAMMILINGLSRSSHVGLLANMGMDGADWAATFAMSAALVVLIVCITRRTTLKIIA